jgi:uncharacterized protein
MNMPMLVNLRHLEADNIRLEGEMSVEELDIDTSDAVIRLAQPLEYDLEIQKLEEGLLIQGSLRLPLQCVCVRCLKSFQHALVLNAWTLHLPLQGEDAVPVINDCVDLTPFLREDILLEFPQHPLCEPECRGLPRKNLGKARNTSSGQPREGSPAWDELNKLKFNT